MLYDQLDIKKSTEWIKNIVVKNVFFSNSRMKTERNEIQQKIIK